MSFLFLKCFFRCKTVFCFLFCFLFFVKPWKPKSKLRVYYKPLILCTKPSLNPKSIFLSLSLCKYGDQGTFTLPRYWQESQRFISLSLSLSLMALQVSDISSELQTCSTRTMALTWNLLSPPKVTQDWYTHFLLYSSHSFIFLKKVLFLTCFLYELLSFLIAANFFVWF